MKNVEKPLVFLGFLRSGQPQLASKIGLEALLSQLEANLSQLEANLRQLEANLRQLETNLRPTCGCQASGGQSGGGQSGGGQSGGGQSGGGQSARVKPRQPKLARVGASQGLPVISRCGD